MLIDLLVNASLAVPDSRFARLLRRLDRAPLRGAGVGARSHPAPPPVRASDAGQAALARRRASQPTSLPSMTARPEAMTSPPTT